MLDEEEQEIVISPTPKRSPSSLSTPMHPCAMMVKWFLLVAIPPVRTFLFVLHAAHTNLISSSEAAVVTRI